jgi:hypothetical protein
VVSREHISWIVCGAIALMLVGLVLFGGGGGGTNGVSGPSASQTAGSAPVPASSGTAVAAADRPVIEQMLTRTFTQNDPKQCTQDVTPAFLRQSFGSEKGTLDRCRRSNTPQQEPAAKSIAVESVTATIPGATAVFRASSDNSMDGSVLTVHVVREGGRWKLEQLVDVQIDRTLLDKHVRDQLGASGYLPAETSCAMAKFDRTVSDQDIERDAVVGGPSPSTGTVEADAVSCLSRPTLLRELSQEFTAVLDDRGLPPRITRCVVDHITHGVPTSRLRNLLAAGLRGSEGWYKLGYQAVVACAGGRSVGPGQASTI